MLIEKVKGIKFIKRPLIVIGGSSESGQESQGAFQEFPQVIINLYFQNINLDMS
jgi:hypothetical protein